ncbi:MAG TPA: nucleoside triphosphate pyrophosphohydrolase [Candidatus Binataceae bacterium]|nr:nucleoside triphosphate pyrophosphohydrolase [Roseiarcus sp.]HZP46612.1 nucleoside triphosphate pyrophosphohydrolase [Candidatus Binataceae bacterium]
MAGNDAENFARLAAIVRELRAKCPWDREQTLATLGKHLIEEAYETADAIDSQAASGIADELGDLLAQSIFAAVIAEQETALSLNQILTQAADKLIRRHPHVYGENKAETADEVVANWSRIKAEERRRAGAQSALDGVGRAMPALLRAEKLGLRARDAGMDWADIHAVLAKVREEMDEVEGALSRNDLSAAAEELGDMLLALGNAPRFIGQSAEEVLRRACDKFARRFRMVEARAAAKGLELTQLTPAQIDQLWQAVKLD